MAQAASTSTAELARTWTVECANLFFEPVKLISDAVWPAPRRNVLVVGECPSALTATLTSVALVLVLVTVAAPKPRPVVSDSVQAAPTIGVGLRYGPFGPPERKAVKIACVDVNDTCASPAAGMTLLGVTTKVVELNEATSMVCVGMVK